MDQIARIKHMEDIFDRSSEAISDLTAALEQYEYMQKELEELAAYYDSASWRKDFGDDEAGKLPIDLKRGVLSEDGIYNLLTENTMLMNTMKQIVEKRIVSKS